jgi:hypothetical protein
VLAAKRQFFRASPNPSNLTPGCDLVKIIRTHARHFVSPDGHQITMISTDKGDVLIATGTRIYY